MPPSTKYSIIDVFSSTAYKGNPLAVVHNLSNTLTTPQMQLLARQFNLSETTFVCPPTTAGATWKLRSFLPNGTEVFGAGHNSLGAWWWIVYSGLLLPTAPNNNNNNSPSSPPSPSLEYQQLGDDVLPVKISSSPEGEIRIALRQGQLQLLDKHPEPAALAEAIGLSVEDLGMDVSISVSVSLSDGDGNGNADQVRIDQARVVTTSAARHLLVPVRDREVLARVSFGNPRRIQEELRRMGSVGSGVYVFAEVRGGLASGKARFEARFFSPGMAMEDPATGSAAGPLVGYLWRLADCEGKGRVEVVQGLAVGRECLMVVDVDGDGVEIEGTGVRVAEGEIVLPEDGVTFP
ncbi:hypothetical protein FE257_000385 [Aspergillus nanangensis]|uniref:Diaminopimelate epimerase-like protein n=1 Tax=Aspergillus nanangensis TaxID=2582783 RepID=A0AAD4GXE2_ASPNN|nr:hypothetical protein FE257_000385 [Aspergillus nanangensis]